MRYSTVRDSTVRRSTCANPWWATLRCATPRCAKSLTDATSLYWRAPLPSTRTGFLCAFWLRDPRFRAFRAQNRGFCALLPSGTPILRPLEHKIGVFVRFLPSEHPLSGLSSTKSGFLCAFTLWNPRFQAFRAQNRHFCARAVGQVASGSVKVAFLQFTAQAFKMQTPQNQIINF